MEILPLEITENILFRLPIVSQLQCRGLCKTWRTLLPRPQKGLLYGVSLSRLEGQVVEFYFSDEKSDRVVNTTNLVHRLSIPSYFFRNFMVGSCNGLVCYAGHDVHYRTKTQRETIVYIFNPFTREQIQLPSIKCAYNVYWNSTMFGFGYVHSSHKYKVVSFRCNDWCGKVDVYTLPSGGAGWRNKASMIKEDFMSYFVGLPSAAVFTGGALHWLNLQDPYKPTPVAFDLERETFELLPLLPFDVTDNNHVQLMELGGDLCVIEVIPSKHITNIWELRHRKIIEYEPCWRMKFSIPWENYLVTTDRESCTLWHNVILSCYDPGTKSLRKPGETSNKLKKREFWNFSEILCATNRLTPHVNSLVSLKGFTGRRGRNSSRGNLKNKIFERH